MMQKYGGDIKHLKSAGQKVLTEENGISIYQLYEFQEKSINSIPLSRIVQSTTYCFLSLHNTFPSPTVFMIVYVKLDDRLWLW